jgi:cathepsin F
MLWVGWGAKNKHHPPTKTSKEEALGEMLILLAILLIASLVLVDAGCCPNADGSICCSVPCDCGGVSVHHDNIIPDVHGYAAWAMKYGKDTEPTGSQLKAWMENHEFVRLQNADSSSKWTAELNKFADMSVQEFKEKILLKNPLVSDARAKVGMSKAVKASVESFDWRNVGGVTPVQDQGFVGTCWTFSTVANIEGQYYKQTNTTLKLSEEYFVDCDGTADYDLNHADCSIYGGWPYLAYQFAIKEGGVPTEGSYPYCAGTGACAPCMNGPEKLCGPPPYSCDRTRDSMCIQAVPVAKVMNWRDVSTDENEIADDLVATGPLSVLLDASTLQFYKSGVWDGTAYPGSRMKCSKTYLDHAVLITGFGVDTTADSVDYWSVKNSWGPDWGEDGYFRIVRGVGECGINTAVTTSIL